MRHANSRVHTLEEPDVSDFVIRNLTPVTCPAQAALATVQREIAACTLCVTAGFIPRSLPIFHGHAEQRLMIVGQAPGPSAGERPLPYTGATGKTLQRWLERAGFPPEALHRDFYLTSLTKCFPGPATGTGAKGDRPPSAREIASARAISTGRLLWYGLRSSSRWGGWRRSASIRRRGDCR